MASTEGTPILRPVWYEFPADENTFALTESFMLGPSVLVCPKVTVPPSSNHFRAKFGTTDNKEPYAVDVYLPNTARWFNFSSKFVEDKYEYEQRRVLDYAE